MCIEHTEKHNRQMDQKPAPRAGFVIYAQCVEFQPMEQTRREITAAKVAPVFPRQDSIGMRPCRQGEKLMTDHMNDEQYRKACRYRMQETIENLAGVWHVPDEQVTPELMTMSLDWLERMVDELKYFRERVQHASNGSPGTGFPLEPR